MRRLDECQRELVTEAPAKLNLRLEVVGRREDGYHALRMISTSLTLSDRVILRLNDSTHVTILVNGDYASEDPGLLDPNRNLASRAARLYLERAGLPFGVEISIEKRIPSGAGLGGGSSDAAAVLRALDREFGAVSPADLLQCAKALGADVPYSLRGGAALVEGIGERISRIPPVLDKRAIAVVKVPEGLSTGEVFASFSFDDVGSVPLALSPEGSPIGPFESWVRNDLFPAAVRLLPSIGGLCRALSEECGRDRIVSMTGSGSALFVVGLFEEPVDELMSRVHPAAESFGARVWGCEEYVSAPLVYPLDEGQE